MAGVFATVSFRDVARCQRQTISDFARSGRVDRSGYLRCAGAEQKCGKTEQSMHVGTIQKQLDVKCWQSTFDAKCANTSAVVCRLSTRRASSGSGQRKRKSNTCSAQQWMRFALWIARVAC